jgi:hypothetical protein
VHENNPSRRKVQLPGKKSIAPSPAGTAAATAGSKQAATKTKINPSGFSSITTAMKNTKL